MPYSTAVRLSLTIFSGIRRTFQQSDSPTSKNCADYFDRNNERTERDSCSSENSLLYIHASQSHVYASRYHCNVFIVPLHQIILTTTSGSEHPSMAADLLNRPVCPHFATTLSTVMPSLKCGVRLGRY